MHLCGLGISKNILKKYLGIGLFGKPDKNRHDFLMWSLNSINALAIFSSQQISSSLPCHYTVIQPGRALLVSYLHSKRMFGNNSKFQAILT